MNKPKVIILAGGLGTRLRDTLGDLPKTLAPVGDRPFIGYLMALLSTQGFTDIIISLGHGSQAVKEFLGTGETFGVRIEYPLERELLGTGGAVKLAETLIRDGNFVVANGDTYLEIDLNAMLAFHEAKGALATVALVRMGETRRYGRVVLGADNRIVSLEEKDDRGLPGYINGGIYIFQKKVLDSIQSGRVCSLEREVLPLLIGKGLYGFASEGYFIDIGIPEDYERAGKELPGRRRDL